ncbi:MAG: response regulator transcription factor [Saprospiraceae bacterium]|nr:response regulator transcription factor [Saprospiraceae bacterium]
MQILQVLLVEDDRSAALDVEMLLDEMGLKLASLKDNAVDALQYIYDEQPDLIILDLELKGDKSGLDIANEINHLRIPIIFTTSFKDKTTFEQTKSTYSFGYLVKPFNKLSLQSTIEQAVKVLFPEDELEGPGENELTIMPDMVLVKHVNMLYPVRYDNILFIQGEGNYCSIHTIQRKYLLKAPLKKMLEAMPPSEFAPIHKSFIVRLDKVESIDVGSGKLVVGKETLPLGRNFKNSFLSRFNQLK